MLKCLGPDLMITQRSLAGSWKRDVATPGAPVGVPSLGCPVGPLTEGSEMNSLRVLNLVDWGEFHQEPSEPALHSSPQPTVPQEGCVHFLMRSYGCCPLGCNLCCSLCKVTCPHLWHSIGGPGPSSLLHMSLGGRGNNVSQKIHHCMKCVSGQIYVVIMSVK